jgi:hypothetical protein
MSEEEFIDYIKDRTLAMKTRMTNRRNEYLNEQLSRNTD